VRQQRLLFVTIPTAVKTTSCSSRWDHGQLERVRVRAARLVSLPTLRAGMEAAHSIAADVRDAVEETSSYGL
jgi:hypothetical protein